MRALKKPLLIVKETPTCYPLIEFNNIFIPDLPLEYREREDFKPFVLKISKEAMETDEQLEVRINGNTVNLFRHPEFYTMTRALAKIRTYLDQKKPKAVINDMFYILYGQMGV